MHYTTLLRTLLVLAVFMAHALPTSRANQVPFQTIVTASQQAASADERLRYGELSDQYGLLWLPQHPSPAPVVVLVHGGCWLQNYDVSHITAAAAALRDDGYVVWAPEYRRASAEQSAWPQALDDVVEAIEFIKTHAHSALNSEPPIVVGHSAGGHLALLASTKTAVTAVIGLAAITDITSYAEGQSGCQQAARWLMGADVNDANANPSYQQANPRLQAMNTTLLLIASAADRIVPIAQASYLKDAQVTRLTDAGHFDFIYPNSTAWQQLRVTLRRITLAPATD